MMTFIKRRMIMQSVKLKCFGVAFCLFLCIAFHWKFKGKASLSKVESVDFKHVVVHLDLKGSPPKLTYLERLLPMFRRLGVNGLLMEYEDSFPYEGKLLHLSSRHRYERNELKDFLVKVESFDIEIIPLVQTFGHLEYALKLEEFKHLREESMYPDSICPSNNGSLILIKEMLEQIMNFHNEIVPLKHIHIGCDEVFHMNKCNKCRKKSKDDLFMDYVLSVKGVVSSINRFTTVLIWDDMFRSIEKHQWNNKKMKFREFESVYWDYKSNIQASYQNIYFYKRFKNMWIASAFKGAEGPDATLPNIKHRFLNHISWMNLVLNNPFNENFKGIILTGWSRYSHMAPMCELLPASMPSLILNLILVRRYRDGITHGDHSLSSNNFFLKHIATKYYHELRCNYDFYGIDSIELDASKCLFDGSRLFNLLRNYKILKLEVTKVFNAEDEIMPSVEYYTSHKMFNVNNVGVVKSWCEKKLKELNNLKKDIAKEMSKYFGERVIEEYLEYKLYWLNMQLQNSIKYVNNYTYIHSWKRRD